MSGAFLVSPVFIVFICNYIFSAIHSIIPAIINDRSLNILFQKACEDKVHIRFVYKQSNANSSSAIISFVVIC